MLPQEAVADLSVLLMPVGMTVGLATFVLFDQYIRPENRRTLLVICALVFSLIAQNYAEHLLETRFPNVLWRTLVAAYGYTVRPVILVMFCRVVNPKRRFWRLWALAAVNAVIYMTSALSHIAFWINEENTFQRGPLSFLCLYISVFMLGYLLYLTVSEFRIKRLGQNWVLLAITAVIIGAVTLDIMVDSGTQRLGFLSLTIVMSSVFYYIWLHLQFVQAHSEEIVAGQRMQIMLTQIQPHFLFNSMEAIRALNRADPEKADGAILKFERYLRGNMDSLTSERVVPFEKELEHTKLYLELEELCYPDELRIRFDLGCMDFSLPSLTLQPLAENAVRHGVRGKKSGEGTVTISTREYPDRYEVAVTDDGPGFDPDAVPKDGRSHIGISNVRERLRYAGADLRIGTRAEGGTEAVITIPKTGDAGGVSK